MRKNKGNDFVAFTLYSIQNLLYISIEFQSGLLASKYRDKINLKINFPNQLNKGFHNFMEKFE